MMISTKGRYALTTLIDIAQNFDGVTPVSIKEISDRQQISMKYLEQIISLMVKGGFLKSIRGARGGYLFTRPIDQILDAAEGTLAPVDCVNGVSTCAKSASCPTFPLYKEIDAAIYEVVNRYTLKDLVEQSAPVTNTSCTP